MFVLVLMIFLLDLISYGQVRIAIDGTHYLKGMAVYKEDLPAGA